MYYSLDGERFIPSESTLVMEPELTPVLYAFVDDELLNLASLIFPVIRPD
jgi:hypothetical protein